MQPCLFCSGDASAPDHDARCCGRQGKAEEAAYTPGFDPDHEAFAGVPAPDVDAIVGAVTPEMIRALVALLGPTPRKADEVRRGLLPCPWFPGTQKRDTQLRRIRTIRDAAIANGHPVCTTNFGYYLGDSAAMLISARRARRYADGAMLRASIMERLAAKMAS